MSTAFIFSLLVGLPLMKEKKEMRVEVKSKRKESKVEEKP